MKRTSPSPTPFGFPDEFGAWWTFESCLAAGLLEAFLHGNHLAASLCLAVGMQATFLDSEWLYRLCGSLLLARKWFSGFQGHTLWIGWKTRQAWLLGGVAAAFLGAGIALAPGLRTELAQDLTAWALFSGVVLWMRVRMEARDARLLMASAALLTGPALVLGLLAFNGAFVQSLGFWGLWAWFFPWSAFYIQTWLRGNTVPRWRIGVASLPFLVEAALLAGLSRPWSGLILFALCVRILWRFRERLLEFSRNDGLHHLPCSPRELRLLVFEQMAWILALAWVCFTG